MTHMDHIKWCFGLAPPLYRFQSQGNCVLKTFLSHIKWHLHENDTALTHTDWSYFNSMRKNNNKHNTVTSTKIIEIIWIYQVVRWILKQYQKSRRAVTLSIFEKQTQDGTREQSVFQRIPYKSYKHIKLHHSFLAYNIRKCSVHESKYGYNQSNLTFLLLNICTVS